MKKSIAFSLLIFGATLGSLITTQAEEPAKPVKIVPVVAEPSPSPVKLEAPVKAISPKKNVAKKKLPQRMKNKAVEKSTDQGHSEKKPNQ